ncbi:MAG: hypothetical protein FJW40_17130 [Acidobacteria bacterium]|nr:hypothetical protein [Acidobacteriota bacterium]
MKLAVPFLFAAFAAQLPAVSVGQIDTFEDGTTQNWLVGLLGAPHPAPPANMAGGPAAPWTTLCC